MADEKHDETIPKGAYIQGGKPKNEKHYGGKVVNCDGEVLAEFKDDEAPKVAAKGSKKPEVKPGKLGLAVTELSAEQKKTLKVAGGVAVEAVDGAALAAGISPGDVILRVNNVDVSSVKSFNEAVSKIDTKKPVALLVRDENGTRFVTFRTEEG